MIECREHGRGETHAERDPIPGGATAAPLEALASWAGASPPAVQAAPPSSGAVGALLAGTKWAGVAPAGGPTLVTYSFATPALDSAYSGAGWSAPFAGTLQPFSDADRALTRQLLDRIESVANLRFVETVESAGAVGAIRYGYSQLVRDMGIAGYAYFPSADASGGDVWLSTKHAAADWDFFRPNLILHETLHALGLQDTEGRLGGAEDIIPNTVMSYAPVAGASRGWMSAYPAEPMALDIAALQSLYGAAPAREGDTVYDLAAAEFRSGWHALWDSGGVDVLDASGLRSPVTLDLSAGARSRIGVAIGAQGTVDGKLVGTVYTSTLALAAGTEIEHAIGTPAADVLIGSQGANTLSGGAGDDTLRGGAGDDTLAGQGGSDVLDGGAGHDTAVYAGPRSSYQVSRSGEGFIVAERNGTDRLTGVERLLFDDGWVALDVGAHAGEAAKLVGALLGPAAVRSGPYVGAALRLLDRGMSLPELADFGLDYRLGAQRSDEAVVKLLLSNLGAGEPPAEQLAPYVDLLQQGVYTQAALAQAAAASELNAHNIDLAGLAARGVDYV